MLMYNLIGYNYNYSKTSGNLWQYYRYEPDFNKNGNIVDFLDKRASSLLLKLKDIGLAQVAATFRVNLIGSCPINGR